VTKIYAPLFDNAVVSEEWVPLLLRRSCDIYNRYKILKEENSLLSSFDPFKRIIQKRNKRKS